MAGIIYSFAGKTPVISPDAYVAPTAVLIGDVTVEEGASIWYGAVLRGDIAPIIVRKHANIQDNTVCHVDEGIPLVVGEGATIGHSVVLHACSIGHHAMIGMHATVLTGATVGDEAIIGAAALVPENAVMPAQCLSLGLPARVVRSLTPEEVQGLHEHAEVYARLGRLATEESPSPGTASPPHPR
ncbi:MAG: gamma carbonic anhydrase family protein [Candidatus Cryosericum sp.]|nr:gamma carbonic anhydrase family protein [Candidatus Cryosericum sp.]HPS69305.1 gamma carbonic anhydrase family protein [Candidatus Cryosericum sp.]